MQKNYTVWRNQKGSVIVVAMIILALLTLIGDFGRHDQHDRNEHCSQRSAE